MDNIEALIDKLAQDGKATRAAPHPFLLALKWWGAATAYLLLLLAFSGVRPDLMGKFHEPWFAAEIAALIGMFAVTCLSAALLVFPDMHQKRGLAMAPVAVFVVFLLVIGFSWRADHPPAPFPEHSWECTLWIVLVALPPAAWTLYAMRSFASTHFRLAGSIALLFAFSIGALWLRLHEMNDSILHLIQWHYLPMLGCGVIGLWLGKVALRW